jgi:predicted Ser/Thr protein kinase
MPRTENKVSQEEPEKLGRYEITGFLGKGAMGVVYEGRDPNIGRRVAIKTARRDVLETSGHADEMMERFLREARAAGALNHPNIVTVYDADEQDGTAYIAMEFIEGSDLQKAIDERRRYAAEEVAEICATICDALHHAHERGVIHRDVKPANIMLLPDGTLRVTDFGIARMADSTLTIDGAMIGTPHYMSPEQFMGHRVDGRSDLFSVAVIAYVLLTGERPFPGDALATVMHAVTQVTPIAPRELNFSISPTLNGVVLKALNKDPNQRYRNAAEMAAALRESTKEAPDPGVTMVAAAPAPSQDDTVSGRRIDDDATVAMTGRSIPAGETIGVPPAADAGADTAADATGARLPAPAPRKPPVLVGAIIAAVVVIGVLFVSLRGGQASDGYSVGPDEPHFAALEVHAFLAPSTDFYDEHGGRVLNPADIHRLEPATAEVVVTYPDGTRQSLGRLPGTVEAVRPFRLHGRPATFSFVLRQEGYDDASMTAINPGKAEAVAEYMVGAPAGNEPILLSPRSD